MLSNEDRERLVDLFDIYDLVEKLDLKAAEIIDAFDFKIEENAELLEAIGYSDDPE
jgi:hypothetical protein